MDDPNATIAHLGLLDDEDIRLDIAALDLSALDHDGADLASYLAVLDDMEQRLGAAGGGAGEAWEQADVLARVIGGEFGFAGDREGYDAPINADMIRVIDRRRGLPISLAILYVAQARRRGWDAYALNTRGHVVIAVGDFDQPIVCDPFGGGHQIDLAASGGLTGDDANPDRLAATIRALAMTNRATLLRLLLNQAVRAEQAGDLARTATIYARMTVVAPEDGKGWWELARLRLRAGDVGGARSSLTAMLEISRDPRQRASILAALDAVN